MKTADSSDVIVIGGGPAGSSAATWLARAGHDVLLLERRRLPSEYVSEALLPFCHELLQDLGVAGELAHHLVRNPGVRFIGRDGKEMKTWRFDHANENETHLSFRVTRGEFDDVLLKNAVKNRVRVQRATSVVEADIASAGDRVRVTTLNAAGEKAVHSAGFLVDADGRCAFVGAKRDGRAARAELGRTTIWSHWGNVRLSSGLEDGLSIVIYMGSKQGASIWVVPLGKNRITAGFVAENGYVREQQKQLRALGSEAWKHDLGYQELMTSSFVSDLLQSSDMLVPMQSNETEACVPENRFGSNYAMIGDSCRFLDPIFSSDVFLLIKSAALVATATHKELSGEETGESGAMAAAYEQIGDAYNLVNQMRKLLWNSQSVAGTHVGSDRGVQNGCSEVIKRSSGFLPGISWGTNQNVVSGRDDGSRPYPSGSWEEVLDAVGRDADRNGLLV